jgi:hypothetical protein
MTGKASLAIYQGDWYAAVVTVQQNGTLPADVLAGFTARAQIRQNVADTEPVVAAEIETWVTSPTIQLSIPASVTKTLSGAYVWDLEIVAPDGTVTTILTGSANVRQEITREGTLASAVLSHA